MKHLVTLSAIFFAAGSACGYSCPDEEAIAGHNVACASSARSSCLDPSQVEAIARSTFKLMHVALATSTKLESSYSCSGASCAWAVLAPGGFGVTINDATCQATFHPAL